MAFLFVMILSFLLAHEMDAVHRSEWRILPGLETLGDEIGRSVFIAGHVPLLAALIWAGLLASPTVQRRAQTCLSTFMVLHIGLHHLWERPELATFDGFLSRLWIWGAGALGFVYLLLRARDRIRQFS